MSKKKEETNVDRKERLKTEINNFFHDVMGCNEKDDYYPENDTETLFAMKNALKTIDNIVTYEASLAAVDVLSEIFEFKEKVDEIKENINRTNPNANGYDIEIEEEKIVVEVKCNNPKEKKDKKDKKEFKFEFYAAQKEGIIKDIKNLCDGKGKNREELKAKLKDYYKFMVLLDTGDGKVKEAAADLLQSPKNSVPKVTDIDGKDIPSFIRDNVVIFNSKKHTLKKHTLNKNTIYILCVSISKK